MIFAKTDRVRARHEYLKFFQGSDVSRLGSCVVFRIANDATHSRLGITVKSRPNSVYRNKVKRQIRESFRLSAARGRAYDYNVVIPGPVKLNHLVIQKIRGKLDNFWKNEGLF